MSFVHCLRKRPGNRRIDSYCGRIAAGDVEDTVGWRGVWGRCRMESARNNLPPMALPARSLTYSLRLPCSVFGSSGKKGLVSTVLPLTVIVSWDYCAADRLRTNVKSGRIQP